LAVRRAKIDDFHFNDLRHTFSTRVQAFTDLFTVRDLMGHKKVDTTDIYITTPLENMRTAVEALANRAKVLAFKSA
jgi:integrase